jgi:uncharacterized membrane protein YgaE (UPF0421/DUF939 family)
MLTTITIGLIMLLAGLVVALIASHIGNPNNSAFGVAVGVAVATAGLLLFVITSWDQLESRFADTNVLSDGGYYRILSVTKNPDDPNTQYVIYTHKQGTVRDVCLTSTNNIPTGMVKWNSADQTFTPLPIEARN